MFSASSEIRLPISSYDVGFNTLKMLNHRKIVQDLFILTHYNITNMKTIIIIELHEYNTERDLLVLAKLSVLKKNYESVTPASVYKNHLSIFFEKRCHLLMTFISYILIFLIILKKISSSMF